MKKIILIVSFILLQYVHAIDSTTDAGTSTLNMLMMKYSSTFIKTTNDVTFDSVFGGGDIGDGFQSSSDTNSDDSMTNSNNWSTAGNSTDYNSSNGSSFNF